MIAARHPRPVTSTQLATELHLAPWALNVTLRSLQRRQLVVAVPATPRQARRMDAVALAIGPQRRPARAMHDHGSSGEDLAQRMDRHGR